VGSVEAIKHLMLNRCLSLEYLATNDLHARFAQKRFMKGDSLARLVIQWLRVARTSIVMRRVVGDKDTYRDRKSVVDKSASIRIQHVSIRPGSRPLPRHD